MFREYIASFFGRKFFNKFSNHSSVAKIDTQSTRIRWLKAKDAIIPGHLVQSSTTTGQFAKRFGPKLTDREYVKCVKSIKIDRKTQLNLVIAKRQKK